MSPQKGSFIVVVTEKSRNCPWCGGFFFLAHARKDENTNEYDEPRVREMKISFFFLGVSGEVMDVEGGGSKLSDVESNKA